MREVHIKMNENPQWNKTIRVDLTLTELQIIYDCVGSTPFCDIHYKHDDEKWNNILLPIMLDKLYDDLGKILGDNNGIIDES